MILYKELLSQSGKRELHAIITAEDAALPFSAQTEGIWKDFIKLRDKIAPGLSAVFMRWFLSDAANQASLLPDWEGCAVSVVEQPPLNLTKAALWVWMIEDVKIEKKGDNLFSFGEGRHRHIFSAGNHRPGMDSESASYNMLHSTEHILRQEKTSLLDACVRTWFFVQNVDVNYAGVVKGRNRAFEELGLTPSTRFIASTGIGGRNADRTSTVQLDTYSVTGLLEGQMRQIGAPEFLNPTYEYGVAFERATSVDYADRRHLFVSGTASIDCFGEVVWSGDIKRQTLRMWENVEALLRAAECGWNDVGSIIVYLRDPADHAVVETLFSKCFPDIPYIIVLAPVCRPGWLIEMECMAMRPLESGFPQF